VCVCCDRHKDYFVFNVYEEILIQADPEFGKLIGFSPVLEEALH
jgi:hypothetical protein